MLQGNLYSNKETNKQVYTHVGWYNEQYIYILWNTTHVHTFMKAAISAQIQFVVVYFMHTCVGVVSLTCHQYAVRYIYVSVYTEQHINTLFYLHFHQTNCFQSSLFRIFYRFTRPLNNSIINNTIHSLYPIASKIM